MELAYYQIDCFTKEIFGGNPACVVPLRDWPSDELLLKIAKENAVAETAFFIENEPSIDLRWFTPEIEMDLCGHATLASAHVLRTILKYPKEQIVFNTLSGELIVTNEDGLYFLDFPARKAEEAELPEIISRSISKQPVLTLKSRDYILLYEEEEEVLNIQMDRQLLDQINLDPGGIVITSPGKNCDFVSRYFTPQASIFEDPVTGSSHCSLIPYWSQRLDRNKMEAMQLSDRKGYLICINKGERVLIGGHAKTFAAGTFWTE